MQRDVFSRFSYFSSQSQQALFSSTWEGLQPTTPVDTLFPEKDSPDDSIWWLDVCDATNRDVETVSQTLSIHPLTTEDVISRETREKVEVFRNYYLISFQTLVTGDDKDAFPSSAGFYILVFRRGAVTFSPSGCEHVRRVRNRIRRMHDPSVLSADWICYALMYGSLYSLSLDVELTANNKYTEMTLSTVSNL